MARWSVASHASASARADACADAAWCAWASVSATAAARASISASSCKRPVWAAVAAALVAAAAAATNWASRCCAVSSAIRSPASRAAATRGPAAMRRWEKSATCSVKTAWRATRSSTSATAAAHSATAASASASRAIAAAHCPVGRPVGVKYRAYSVSIRSISNGSVPQSPPLSPAATSSARDNASHPDKSTAAVDADCSTRWACQRSLSTVSASIARTRSWASSPVSCSRHGVMIVSSVSHFL